MKTENLILIATVAALIGACSHGRNEGSGMSTGASASTSSNTTTANDFRPAMATATPGNEQTKPGEQTGAASNTSNGTSSGTTSGANTSDAGKSVNGQQSGSYSAAPLTGTSSHSTSNTNH